MLPVLPMLPVANVANAQLGVGNWNWQHFHIGNILKSLLCFLMLALVARAEPGYTNHAGNVVSGWPVKLTATHVVLSDGGSPGRLGGTPRPTCVDQPPTTNYQLTTTYPLSIFPESERRRIATDFVLLQGVHLRQGYGGQAGAQVGLLRVPVAVKRAIAGAEKAMARSRKRAEKGLCTKEESEAFCAKSEAALKSYLDKQVESGVITPAERKALGR